MTIGLVTHDVKKKLIQNFCITRRGILSKNTLCTTGTTEKLIEEVTNLSIHKYLTSHLDGIQQMAAQIERNKMGLVIFLRDPSNSEPHEPDVNNVVRPYDIYNIPLATNLASTELLIKALGRGDME